MQRIGSYCWRLYRSIAATYSFLERPTSARRAVVLLLAVHTSLLAYSAYVHSPTLNEPGHLVAGLSYWKFDRFDVYNVNPPLVKMVAALPVMAAGYEEDWSSFYSGLGARPEFSMGKDFVAANGVRSLFLVVIARWACIPFSLLGAVISYLWARDLYGRPAGVMACSIWCFEPNILAHASLITPDAHASALGLAACYTFWRWLKKPTWSQAALTGVILGLAELAKTTLILLYPLWPLMWLAYRWRDRGLMQIREWLREAAMLVVRMLIGLYILNLGYGFEDSLKPLGEYRFVSTLLTGADASEPRDPFSSGPAVKTAPTSSAEHPAPDLGGIKHNRFARTWLGSIPVPFPANYISGIDIQQQDFEDYRRQSYLRGEWRDHGWCYYYLYAIAIKVPIGVWLLGITSIIMRLHAFLLPKKWRQGGSSYNRNTYLPDEFILLFPAIVIFAVVSSKTGFNEHMRYVLPAFPFLFIFACSGLTNRFGGYNAQSPRRIDPRAGYFSVKLLSLSWLVTSSMSIYPHSLSYFNEIVGGPVNGPNHLLGSNVDWGQDLTLLNDWVATQPNTCPLRVASCSPIEPYFFGLTDLKPFQPTTGNPDLETGWYALSVNLVAGGQHGFYDRHSFDRFKQLVPRTMVGYSFLLYFIDSSEVDPE